MDLASDDQCSLLSRQGSGRVILPHHAPVVNRRTKVSVRVVSWNVGVFEVEPFAVTTREVLDIISNWQ